MLPAANINFTIMKKTDIIITCDCGKSITIDLAEQDLDWEIVETDEREMGVERLHEAIFDYACPDCKKNITITLHVWEYPEGFCNMDEIGVEGGELVNGCNLEDFVL